jgi:hypothetical protein
MDSVCPITQEPIHNVIVLRGSRFELTGVLDLLRSRGPNATHPYERTPFTATELRTIHLHALQLAPAYLMQEGWVLPSRFLQSVRGDGSDEIVDEADDRQQQEYQVCVCTVYEVLTLLLLLLLVFLSIFTMIISSRVS